MSTDTIPETAGLEQGNELKDAGRQAARRGDTLLSAAAAGGDLTPKEALDLVGYFLTNDGLPGDDDPVPVEVTTGTGSKTRKSVWEIRPIAWEEWQDGVDRGTDEKSGEFDRFVAASYHVARALVKPQLGPVVQKAQSNGPGGPQDAAELLRRMFKRQAGVLLELSGKVMEISKLQSNNESVRTLDVEVQAGKD